MFLTDQLRRLGGGGEQTADAGGLPIRSKAAQSGITVLPVPGAKGISRSVRTKFYVILRSTPTISFGIMFGACRKNLRGRSIPLWNGFAGKDRGSSVTCSGCS